MAQNGQGMDPAVLDDIINRLLEFRQARSVRQVQVQLSEAEIRQLCTVLREIFLQQPNLLELEAPIKICGRGQFKFMGKNEGFVYKRSNQLFPNDSLYPTRCEVSVGVSSAGLARMLMWGEGYYNGEIKTRKTVQPMEVSLEEASLQRSQQLIELYESLSAGESNQQTRRSCASLSPEDLTELEWFYLMCVSFSFPPGVGYFLSSS